MTVNTQLQLLLSMKNNPKTLLDIFEMFKKRGNKTASVYQTGIRKFSYSYKEIYNLSLNMASFLERKGVKKADRVLLWAPNSPWWIIAFFGILQRGAIVVPVDFISRKKRAESIADDAGCSFIIQSLYKFEKIDKGKKVLIEDLQYLLADFKQSKKILIKPSDIAEIVYTSGTTGKPKGVVLTHCNIVTNILSVAKQIPSKPSYNFLSLLPLSHMFEQAGGMLIPLFYGAKIVYLRTLKPTEIMEALKEEQIAIIVLVPRLLQLLKFSVERELENKHIKSVFTQLLLLSKKLPARIKKLLFAPIHKQFGDTFVCFITGGAPLDNKVALFWQMLGFKVVEGYGLTECSPVLSVHTLQKQILGSQGKIIPEVRLKVSDEKEILAKGKNIFSHYWQNKKATLEAFDKDGWFRTGDTGKIDNNGYVYIRGRKKDTIITASGVNVYPDDVEAVLNNIAGVRESCVIGVATEEGEQVYAVLLLSDPKIKPETILQKANQQLDPQLQISNFSLWQWDEFPKTTTLKIQRFKVKQVLQKGQSDNEQPSEDRLIALLSRISTKPVEQIHENSFLVTDLGMSSIARLELTNYLEQEYRVDLEDTAINQNTTVHDIRKTIEKREGHASNGHFRYFYNSWWGIAIRKLVDQTMYSPLLNHYTRRKIIGLENIKNLKTPVIFICNHVSYVDAQMAMIDMPNIVRYRTCAAAREEFFFAKRGLLMTIVMRIYYEWCIISTNAFLLPQYKGFRTSLRYMGKLANHNINILLFPEGERSRTGKLLPFKPGLGLLVKELQVPILPIKISGMEHVFPRGASWFKKGNVTVIYGKPIYFTTETPSEIVEKAKTALSAL